ncbi:MAG: hypothetical protein HC915_21265 [Anaerolineae bacterium]|nr:hypothetical protein [Anaerolineae bacterium]
MHIIEDRAAWEETYRTVWLDHFQKTGETDWKIYPRPTNHQPISGPAIDLSQSRLMLITSAGSYLKDQQDPFDAANPLGDYTLRLYPAQTDFAALAYAHEHYDHAAVNADPQVLVPLRHLEQLVQAGVIGKLAPMVVSFSGYLPDAARVEDELLPAILAQAQAQGAQGPCWCLPDRSVRSPWGCLLAVWKSTGSLPRSPAGTPGGRAFRCRHAPLSPG